MQELNCRVRQNSRKFEVSQYRLSTFDIYSIHFYTSGDQRQVLPLLRCWELIAATAMATTQVAQTRAAVRGVQDDFNAFKADVNHSFTSLRDALLMTTTGISLTLKSV
jgi:hypothetical protein